MPFSYQPNRGASDDSPALTDQLSRRRWSLQAVLRACTRYFFDTIARLSSVGALRRLANVRIRSARAEFAVNFGFLLVLGSTTAWIDSVFWHFAIAFLFSVLVYLLMMSTMLRVTAPGNNVMVKFSRSGAALHLLRPSPGSDVRILWDQLKHSVHDALDVGVTQFTAESPLLLKDAHRVHLAEQVCQELEKHAEIVGVTVTHIEPKMMSRLVSIMYRLSYQDAMPAIASSYVRQHAPLEMFLPERLRLVPAVKVVIKFGRLV